MADGKNFEVVFVSVDRDERSFSQYLSAMPWVSLTYDDARALRRMLQTKFKIWNFPALVILNKNCATITKDGIAAIRGDPGGANFPWKPKSLMSKAFTPLVTKAKKSLKTIREPQNPSSAASEVESGSLASSKRPESRSETTAQHPRPAAAAPAEAATASMLGGAVLNPTPPGEDNPFWSAQAPKPVVVPGPAVAQSAVSDRNDHSGHEPLPSSTVWSDASLSEGNPFWKAPRPKYELPKQRPGLGAGSTVAPTTRTGHDQWQQHPGSSTPVFGSPVAATWDTRSLEASMAAVGVSNGELETGASAQKKRCVTR